MVYKKEVYLQMFKTITEAVEMTLYKNAVKKIRAAKQAMKK
jgi:hypothetical protein